MINKVTLLGNLARDAETVNGSQTTMTRMRLATHTNWRDATGEWQRRAEFHNLVAFGDLAERCSMYCTKGRRIFVDGHLRTRDWTGSDGLRRFSTEIVVDHVRYLDSAGISESPDDSGDDVDDDAEDTPAIAVVTAPVTAARTSRPRSAPAARGADQSEANSAPAAEGLDPTEDIAAAV